MMDAVEKTKNVTRKFLPIGKVVPNPENPNQMSGRDFDLLVDNVERTGLTDPILVRPLEDGTYRIVGGHHRYAAAEYLGFEEVPVTIIDDEEFDEEAERFQLVRMNVIRGKMSPDKFVKLYNSVSDKYADDVLQELFGFSDEAAFEKLIRETSRSLPDDRKRVRALAQC